MDPNTALENIREAIRSRDWDDLIEAFEALDGWLQDGGFLPRDWDNGR